MKDLGIRTGSTAMAQPVVIGTDTVYEHKDIVQVTEDAEGNPVDNLWQYHEYQYTHEEWMKELGERNQELESQVTDAEIALVELYELIGG